MKKEELQEIAEKAFPERHTPTGRVARCQLFTRTDVVKKCATAMAEAHRQGLRQALYRCEHLFYATDCRDLLMKMIEETKK